MNNRKLQYFLDCMTRYGSDKRCPFCGSSRTVVIDSKAVFARLFECSDCHLYFRHPKDSKEASWIFYQNDYEETDITRNIPAGAQLEEFKKSSFLNSGKDYSDRIQIIKLLCHQDTPIKVVDYGCSWGYASYQFLKVGFSVQSFEISKPMVERGNSLLGLDIKNDVDLLLPDNDVFFSAHVIEHVTDLVEFFQIAKKLLKKGGLMITYCPNGSDDFRSRKPEDFHSIWGMVHPNYLNVDFFKYVFKDVPYLITSSPYKNLDVFGGWNKFDQVVADTSGDELLAVGIIE